MCDVKIGRLGKFDFNPRGELWRKDENRFGHKFLTKFGWSQGKGLGKNEDGIAENLKVRLKVGNTGVGWDEKLPIGIDYREYDAVLGDLSKKYLKSGEGQNETISLEKRSQQFKNRLHYQKFVRGKDISRYSEKDMSCIFLSREPEKDMESPLKESTVTNTESHPSQLPDKESMPTFNSQMSVADYFAMKMKNKTGSSFNEPKESKSCEEPPKLEINDNKKRKHELKFTKKVKRIKQEQQLNAFDNKSGLEEDNSESSNSSQEAPEENLVSTYSEESVCSKNIKTKKKSSKKMKKFLETFKLKQDLVSHGQEKCNNVKENLTDKETEKLNESSSDSPDESKGIAENEAITKKRKKQQKSYKKAKKLCIESENSTDVYENVSDDKERNSSKECSVKSLENEKQSRKESKKHKNEIPSLKGCLKSCLSNNKYSFKEKRNVSFSENISYKTIENVLNINNVDSDIVLETTEQLLSCSDEDCTDVEVVNETDHIERNPVENFKLSDKSTKSDDKISNELQHTDDFCHEDLGMVEDNTVPECFKLPKRSSKNYDGWLETQRIAAKMKVYKNMAKKMKKHPVFRKTNLLEIKGYGNWGI